MTNFRPSDATGRAANKKHDAEKTAEKDDGKDDKK